MKKLVAVAAVVLVLLAGSTVSAGWGYAVPVVPAPVVSYMPVAPVAAYYPPPVVVYRPPLVVARPVMVAPAPVVIVRPRVLIPGQPVRNVLRVTWP